MDGSEFEQFASARWSRLVRAGVLLGCDRHAAEDLAQTALLRCFVSWSKVRAADDQDAYVAKILINSHRQSRRRRWWRELPTASPPEGSTPDGSAAVDGTETVRRALANLTDEHREVVVLRYYEQLDERRMAEVLGVPRGTVKSRLSRALDRLADSPHLSDLNDGGTP